MVSWDTRRLSSSGYWIFSQPEICCGDQSRISLLATIFCSFTWIARRQRLGAKPRPRPRRRVGLHLQPHAPPGGAASRPRVGPARSGLWEIAGTDEPETPPRRSPPPPPGGGGGGAPPRPAETNPP